MKRDMDHLRDLMLRIDDAGEHGVNSQDLSDVDRFHMDLLDDAGFIRYSAKWKAFGTLHHDRLNVVLTFQGGEYVDGIRDQDFWERVKDTARDRGLPLVLDVVKQTVALLAKQGLVA